MPSGSSDNRRPTTAQCQFAASEPDWPLSKVSAFARYRQVVCMSGWKPTTSRQALPRPEARQFLPVLESLSSITTPVCWFDQLPVTPRDWQRWSVMNHKPDEKRTIKTPLQNHATSELVDGFRSSASSACFSKSSDFVRLSTVFLHSRLYKSESITTLLPCGRPFRDDFTLVLVALRTAPTRRFHVLSFLGRM